MVEIVWYFKNTHPFGEKPNFVGLLDYYLRVFYYFTVDQQQNTGVGGRTRIFFRVSIPKGFFFVCLPFFFFLVMTTLKIYSLNNLYIQHMLIIFVMLCIISPVLISPTAGILYLLTTFIQFCLLPTPTPPSTPHQDS